MILLLTFTLCIAVAAFYLSRELGLCDDVWCRLHRRSEEDSEPLRSQSIVRGGTTASWTKTRGAQITTVVYMIHAPGCIHCKNAMPEFRKLQQRVSPADRNDGLGIQAELLLPADIPTAIPEIKSPGKFLAQGVPLYLVVSRPAPQSHSNTSTVTVYKGPRTAQAILQFASSLSPKTRMRSSTPK